MENEALIFDLVERYDFDELSDLDQKRVLETCTKEEYQDMRQTIHATTTYFEKPISNITIEKSLVSKAMSYTVEVYKVAAALLLIFGGLALILSLNDKKEKLGTNIIASSEIKVNEKRDTIFIQVVDTVEKIQEKIVYIYKEKVTPFEGISPSNINRNTAFETNCKKLCPNDLEALSNLKTKNDISQDSVLNELFVTVY